MTYEIKFTQGGYGFEHNWNLVMTDRNGTVKSFFLGQDVKFCNRVLGMEPGYVVRQIGSGDLRLEKTRKDLGKFIVKSLGLSARKLKKMETWELCCQ